MFPVYSCPLFGYSLYYLHDRIVKNVNLPLCLSNFRINLSFFSLVTKRSGKKHLSQKRESKQRATSQLLNVTTTMNQHIYSWLDKLLSHWCSTLIPTWVDVSWTKTAKTFLLLSNTRNEEAHFCLSTWDVERNWKSKDERKLVVKKTEIIISLPSLSLSLSLSLISILSKTQLSPHTQSLSLFLSLTHSFLLCLPLFLSLSPSGARA